MTAKGEEKPEAEAGMRRPGEKLQVSVEQTLRERFLVTDTKANRV